MNTRTKLAFGVAGTAALAIVVSSIGSAASSRDDTPLESSAYERAAAAALAHVGSGTVIETEVGDDGAAYGVEVRRSDGTVVEVNLDSNFDVIGSAEDDSMESGADED